MVRYWSHLPRIRIMAEYAAKIEVRSDGEAEREEIRSCDEVQDCLANGTYPEETTKAVKAVIRKRAKKFQLMSFTTRRL